MTPAATRSKSFAERLFHAIAFEVIAVLICAPLLSWLMHQPLERTSGLSLAVSLTAVLWNIVVTRLQDHLVATRGLVKNWRVRLAHAFVFEAGLTGFAVVVAASLLHISYWQALVLDAGLLLFFLPYTVVFNWLCDSPRPMMER